MNYWDYIKVEELLALQTGRHRSEDEIGTDEVLFIVAHQIYELWFKLVLRELDGARAALRRNPVPDQSMASVTRSLRRCATIFEVATHHWRVLETLTSRDYLEFRDQLIGASGFQSAQLREIEVLLGLDDAARLSPLAEGSYKDALRGPGGAETPASVRIERRIAGGPSFKHALYDWLSRTPIDGSSDEKHVEKYLAEFLASYQAQARTLTERAVARATAAERPLIEERYVRDVDACATFLHASDVKDPAEAARRRHVRAAMVFIESHRELPRLSWPREVLDATLALEQAMIIWRQRHARMVERMIGRRTGTGGSGGVEYLDQTALRYRIFDDLWAVRTFLLRRDLVPELQHPDDYRLRIED
jgi:tryptophan 2,3-dioxygenase